MILDGGKIDCLNCIYTRTSRSVCITPDLVWGKNFGYRSVQAQYVLPLPLWKRGQRERILKQIAMFGSFCMHLAGVCVCDHSSAHKMVDGGFFYRQGPHTIFSSYLRFIPLLGAFYAICSVFSSVSMVFAFHPCLFINHSYLYWSLKLCEHLNRFTLCSLFITTVDVPFSSARSHCCL